METRWNAYAKVAANFAVNRVLIRMRLKAWLQGLAQRLPGNPTARVPARPPRSEAPRAHAERFKKKHDETDVAAPTGEAEKSSRQKY